jgi:hypothetical protein
MATGEAVAVAGGSVAVGGAGTVAVGPAGTVGAGGAAVGGGVAVARAGAGTTIGVLTMGAAPHAASVSKKESSARHSMARTRRGAEDTIDTS